MDPQYANQCAIDLGDTGARVCFQVTSQRQSMKIQKTIDMFLKHNLANHFDKIRILIIGRRTGDYPSLRVPNGIAFDPKHDVVDIRAFGKHIKTLDAQHMEKLLDIIKRETSILDTIGEPVPFQEFTIGFEDVVVSFERMKHWQTTDIRKLAHLVQEYLLRNGIRTKRMLRFFLSSQHIFDQIDVIYRREIGRPVDPVGMATWGAVLFINGSREDTRRWVEERVRMSEEYRMRQGSHGLASSMG